MVKIKTIRGATKRFKKTSSGNYKHKKTNMRHILTKKTSKRKRHLRKHNIISKCNKNKLVLCIPYK